MQISKEQFNRLPERLQKHFAHGNINPCVKPTALMRYLCRLITPPGGSIIDPFIGSGTTCVAAIQEGFQCVGIDDDKSSCNIANARIKAEQQQLKLNL